MFLKLSADQLVVFNDCLLRSKISHCQRNYVLWLRLHRQRFDFGSVNTTLNDLLCSDIEIDIDIVFFIVYILRIGLNRPYNK